MPRKAKEEAKEEAKKVTKNIVKKASDTKKATEKKTSVKKTTTKKNTTKKTTTQKETKKVSTKASPSKKTTKTVKTNSSNQKNKSNKTKKTSKMEMAEYYDLPYRYNQTIVKILAQTPNTLFVYWDISDEDRKKYMKQYGPYFFNDTKPVLLVHNKTKNCDFEIDINDFANSWYIHLVDSDCEYEIELGRRPMNEYAKINDFLPVSQSNSMQSPNDHILLDKLSRVVYFKNTKTNEIKSKTTLSLLNRIGKLSSMEEFYQKLYPEEEINFDKLDLRNPSSSSSFK